MVNRGEHLSDDCAVLLPEGSGAGPSVDDFLVRLHGEKYRCSASIHAPLRGSSPLTHRSGPSSTELRASSCNLRDLCASTSQNRANSLRCSDPPLRLRPL